MRRLYVQQLDIAAFDTVDARMQLSTPGRIHRVLIHGHFVGVKAEQAAMNHCSAISLIEGEESLLNF
jgi:hypothetical protein